MKHIDVGGMKHDATSVSNRTDTSLMLQFLEPVHAVIDEAAAKGMSCVRFEYKVIESQQIDIEQFMTSCSIYLHSQGYVVTKKKVWYKRNVYKFSISWSYPRSTNRLKQV